MTPFKPGSKYLFAVLFLALCWVAPAALAAAEEETPELPRAKAEIVDFDPTGVWSRSKSFGQVKDEEGVQVISFPDEKNFFAYYVPPGHKPERVMVAVHGTGGSPYEELKDEIPMAKEFDYIVVAVNWFKPDTGFFKADALYNEILEALAYVQKAEKIELDKVGYIGFSRGAAVSYEIAYLDAHSKYHLFKFFIAHSGGIPADFRVEAKNEGSQPDNFMRKLALGGLGQAPMKGTTFFLYSGDLDEHWKLKMSEQVGNAKNIIEKNGGTVVEWVHRTDLGHGGLRKDRSINEKAVRAFIEKTP